MRVTFVLVASLMLIGFVSAGFGYTDVDGPVLLIPEATTNTTIINTNHSNSSDYWDTLSLGSLNDANSTQFFSSGNVLNLDEAWVDSLWCRRSGCTMSGNIDMDGNNITGAGTIEADYFVGDGSGLTGVATEDTNFETYLNGSAYNNITYNLTAGDVDNLERTIEPGKTFIFGDTFT